jgi:hypothetical protein
MLPLFQQELAIPRVQTGKSIVAEEFYCKGSGFTLFSSWRPEETKDDPRYMTLARDGAQLRRSRRRLRVC